MFVEIWKSCFDFLILTELFPWSFMVLAQTECGVTFYADVGDTKLILMPP